MSEQTSVRGLESLERRENLGTGEPASEGCEVRGPGGIQYGHRVGQGVDSVRGHEALHRLSRRWAEAKGQRLVQDAATKRQIHLI
jgi:hypothetical protein